MIHPHNSAFCVPIAALFRLCVGAPDDEKIRRTWNDYSASTDRYLYIHFESREPSGLIGVEKSYERPTVIRHLAVASHHQKRGIGRLLIDQFSDEILIAETDNDAVAFYKKCGFAIRSLGEKYPGVERFECTKKRPIQCIKIMP